eukprot:m51a1_g2796 hypothetical protein (186) ;mRNA; r:70790-71538
MNYVRVIPVEVTHLKPGREVYVGLERGIGLLRRVDASTARVSQGGGVTPINIRLCLFEKTSGFFISSRPALATVTMDVAAAVDKGVEQEKLQMELARNLCSSALTDPQAPELVVRIERPHGAMASIRGKKPYQVEDSCILTSVSPRKAAEKTREESQEFEPLSGTAESAAVLDEEPTSAQTEPAG